VEHPDGGASDLSIAFGMALAVHSGGYDSTLSPLPMEQQSAVVEAYREMKARKAFGHGTADIDLQGMTIDDADALEEMIERRERRRTTNGLAGES